MGGWGDRAQGHSSGLRPWAGLERVPGPASGDPLRSVDRQHTPHAHTAYSPHSICRPSVVCLAGSLKTSHFSRSPLPCRHENSGEKSLACINLWFRWLACFRLSFEQARGLRTLAERPAPRVGASTREPPPRMAHLQVWPHWGVLYLSAVSTEFCRGCGVAVLLVRALGLAGKWTHAPTLILTALARRFQWQCPLALALKPSRPLL